MLQIIQKEEARRNDELDQLEPDYATGHWVVEDAPFIAEFCLMILVGVRHHIERQLLSLAARAVDNGKQIDRQLYAQRRAELVDPKRRLNWTRISSRLDLEGRRRYTTVDVVRLLANDYKHDPGQCPERRLLEILNLDTSLNYARLTESSTLQKGLARFLGLPENAAYTQIIERILDHLEDFLADVEALPTISPLKPGRMRFDSDSMLH